MVESKQVLVMKQFKPKLRTGKYCSQAGHAAVGAVFSQGEIDGDYFKIPLHDPFVRSWVIGRFKKITVYVETDEELIDLHERASKLGLFSCIIRDAGLTEFNGVATITAVGIGPGDPALIDSLTGNLPLF